MLRKWRFWLIVALVAGVVYWLVRLLQEEEKLPFMMKEILMPPTPTQPPHPAPVKVKTVKKVDDLTRIRGIGPKITAVLQAVGITSFTQLARAEASELKRILRAGGVRPANVETWAEQAKKLGS